MSDKEKYKRYDQLILRNRSLIVKVCQIYCHQDKELARDLYQDIALNIWTHMDSYRKESSEATWVWHLAANTAIDRLRTIQRRPILVTSESFPERAAEGQLHRIDDLYEAIAHLSADDQRLVAARMDGYSYQEIALMGGQSEGALRVRYNRIVKQLRELMKGK